MNFLQRLSSKSAASNDAYGSVSTGEENATTSPHADSLQDADNFRFGAGNPQGPAVVIRDKLKVSSFLEDTAQPKASAPTSIASGTSNLFSNWSAAGPNAVAAVTKKDTTPSSKDSEPEPTEGKLMGEISIDWNYVSPAEPRTGGVGNDDVSNAERLNQTKKVLEEEVRLQHWRGAPHMAG